MVAAFGWSATVTRRWWLLVRLDALHRSVEMENDDGGT